MGPSAFIPCDSCLTPVSDASRIYRVPQERPEPHAPVPVPVLLWAEFAGRRPGIRARMLWITSVLAPA